MDISRRGAFNRYITRQTLDDDQDGLFNYYEVTLGTKPSLSDSDGDGWSDGAELPRKFTQYVAGIPKKCNHRW